MVARALVTGSSGLVGRHLVPALELLGFQVDGVDIVPGPATILQWDVRDFFRSSDVHYEVAVHCAAVVGGRALVESPLLAHASNIEADAAFFTWAQATEVEYPLYISSCAAYPDWLQQTVGHRLREEDLTFDGSGPWLPDNVYGWAKLTGEYLARKLGNVGVARPFGIYGPGQASGHPLASFTAQAQRRADPIVVWGNGTQVRDLIHVSDVVFALCAMVSQRYLGAVNIATGRPVSLTEAATICGRAAGYRPEIQFRPDLPGGLPYRCADVTRLHQLYHPAITLEDGVRSLIESSAGV